MVFPSDGTATTTRRMVWFGDRQFDSMAACVGWLVRKVDGLEKRLSEAHKPIEKNIEVMKKSLRLHDRQDVRSYEVNFTGAELLNTPNPISRRDMIEAAFEHKKQQALKDLAVMKEDSND